MKDILEQKTPEDFRPDKTETSQKDLYQNLVDIYKYRRKAVNLTDDDEVYKWKLADECIGKSNLEIVKLCISNHVNLIGWRDKNQLRAMLNEQSKELDRLLADLYDERQKPKERMQRFILDMKSSDHGVDERTVSVLLGAKMPNKYIFYKYSCYKKLCTYLGIKCEETGNKYFHYMEILQPIVELVSKDAELKGLLEKDISNLIHSDLITVQDVVYTKFERDPITDNDNNCEFYKELAELLRFKKNIIIEGAPGVGKTYLLPRIITRLCCPELSNAPQSQLESKFNELRERRQVEYITFHQSMDYEEFVEGIRPKTDSDGNISYEVVSGIFKQMCDAAKRPITEENVFQINSGATIWKVSLAGTGDNPVRRECMENGHIRIGWDHYGEDLSNVPGTLYEGRVVLNAFYDKMQVGDIVFSCYSSRTIDAIGVVTGDPEWHNEYSVYKRVRKVEWLVKGINENIYDINNQTVMVLATVYRLNNITIKQVLDILQRHGVMPDVTKKNTRPYVLVIDEINRGNVSKIFGELITLIEPDKRLDREAETEVELPYSKERFSVPDNLYIIGTMNTADRSLETLDYAMRRRFAFVKFKPQQLSKEGFNKELFELVSKLFIKNFDEYIVDKKVAIQPAECLSKEILPTDVWIGHSYFLMDNNGVDRTRMRIRYEIIPVLEEYIKDGVFEDTKPVKEVINKLVHYETEETDD